MSKNIKNQNNSLYYYHTDKNEEVQAEKIANYAIQSLFILKNITNTKNVFKISEELIL